MFYGEKENRQLVILKAGQVFKLCLPSNPTSGYNWAFQSKPDEKIFRLVEEVFLSSKNKSRMVGEGGNQYWTFESITPGRTSFILVYKRAWEHVPPLKTYNLKIEVC